jgi:phosphatidylinositol glycan class B
MTISSPSRTVEPSVFNPSPTSSPVEAWFLFLMLLIALLFRIVAAHAPNVVHPDEIFQTQEPAHHLAYGYGVVTWEWRDGIRSWVFPAFLAGVMRATSWMGAQPSGYLRGITLVLSLISLTTVWFGFAWARRTAGMQAAIIAAGCCAIWYQLIDFGGRALTEVFATHLLLPGLFLGAYGEQIPERKRMFWAGLLCGLAVSLRIQLAPAVAFALLWFCGTQWRMRAMPLGVGFILPVAAFGVVDWFTWSYPFQSFVRYFWVNAIEGRSKIYGVEPWYWYLLVLLGSFGPMLFFVLIGCLRSPFLGCIAFVLLATHSALAHKEQRFLYPLIPIAVTLAALGIEEVVRNFALRDQPVWSSRVRVATALLICGVASFLLAPRFPYWAKNSGAIVAFDRLSHDSGLCGLGIYAVLWADTGGYTHLHRNVPIVPVSDASGLRADAEAFNVLIAPKEVPDLPLGFKLNECWNGVCLYRRSGVCALPQRGSELNAYLQRTGN